MGVRIAQKEGALALYKGLGAVVSGIVPKMAIRFSSFEIYKGMFADKVTGETNMTGVFFGSQRPDNIVGW
jgi:solute carrier family 25 citrate transporter 1